MQIKRCLTTLLFLIIFISFSFSQGYKIGITVKDFPNKNIILGYHYNGEIFKADSLITDSKGNGEFSGVEDLPGGMYLIYFPSGKYFEILLSDKQQFSIICDKTDFLNTVFFVNSPENTAFFNYQKKLSSFYIRKNKLIEELNKYGADSVGSYKIKINNIGKNIARYKKDFVEENKEYFVSTLIRCTINPEFTDMKNKPDGMPDSTYAYLEYRKHFFDNVDFLDKRLLRTTVFYNKLNHFLKNLMPADYDEIKKEVDKILEKAKINEEVYKHTLTIIFDYYRKSKVITHEIVGVYIAENYYLKSDLKIYPALKKKMESYVKATKPSLVGNIAPALEMEDISGNIRKLYDTDAKYIILYFYDTDCEVCKSETPKLKKLYDRFKSKDVEVIAFYAFEKNDAWKNYVEENDYFDWINVHDPENLSGFRELYNIHGSPTVFLLNKNKRIVIKYITIEQLTGLLEKFLK